MLFLERNDSVKTHYLFCTLMVVLLCNTVFAGKDIFHYISLPVIEGAGIYASVASLTDDNSTNLTKAASVTNLALMAANGALGMTAALSEGDRRYNIRKAHRIIGFIVTGASVWLSVSNSVDEVKMPTRIVSYCYSGLTLIPIITFSF